MFAQAVYTTSCHPCPLARPISSIPTMSGRRVLPVRKQRSRSPPSRGQAASWSDPGVYVDSDSEWQTVEQEQPADVGDEFTPSQKMVMKDVYSRCWVRKSAHCKESGGGGPVCKACAVVARKQDHPSPKLCLHKKIYEQQVGGAVGSTRSGRQVGSYTGSNTAAIAIAMGHISSVVVVNFYETSQYRQ